MRRAAPVHDEGGGKDGYVSLEVDPNLAHDTEGTIEEAKRLHGLIDKPNLFIKIPATQGGPARDRGDDRGRHPRQRDADLLARAPPRGRRGLRPRPPAPRRRAAATSPRSPPSPRSSSRASTPRATSASTRSAATTSSRASSRSPTPSSPTSSTRRSSPASSGRRCEAKGATAQRCLWASTSTKNPEYRDVIYVEELVGPDTVNTMPRATVEAVLDHGEIRDSLEEDVDGARKVLDGPQGRRDRLRRRRGDAREGGRAEVRRLLQGALLGHRVQARLSSWPRDGRQGKRLPARARPAAAGRLDPLLAPPPARATRPPRCRPPT